MKEKIFLAIYLLLHLVLIGPTLFFSSFSFIFGCEIYLEDGINIIDPIYAFGWLIAWGTFLADSLLYLLLIKKTEIDEDDAKTVFASDKLMNVIAIAMFLIVNINLLVLNVGNLIDLGYWCYVLSFVPLSVTYYFVRRLLYRKVLKMQE